MEGRGVDPAVAVAGLAGVLAGLGLLRWLGPRFVRWIERLIWPHLSNEERQALKRRGDNTPKR